MSIQDRPEARNSPSASAEACRPEDATQEPSDASSDGQQTVEQTKTIWSLFEEIWGDLTEEEVRSLPTDGAEQHDYYIYGLPKRE